MDVDVNGDEGWSEGTARRGVVYPSKGNGCGTAGRVDVP